jgi:membrane carboxypeptidase/penicillin-binding protein
MGDGISGIEAAARHYFGKGAGGLTAREAAASCGSREITVRMKRIAPTRIGRMRMYRSKRSSGIIRVRRNSFITST